MNINKTKILKIILLISLIILISIMLNLIFSNDVSNKLDNITNKEETKENQDQITIYDKLNENKYSFKVTSNINNVEEYIEGNIEKNTVTVNINNNSIIKNTKDFNSIRPYFQYINLDNIKTMIDLSLIKSKEKDKIIYEIDIFDLVDMYNYTLEYDPFSKPVNDTITVTFIDEYIKTIDLNLNNYYKFINKDNSNLNIKIEYIY